jgi:hypothetical protein
MPNASGLITLFLKSGIPAPAQTIPLHTHGAAAASGSAYGISSISCCRRSKFYWNK